MDFKNMNLNPALLRAVTELGFTEATPIQVQSIPLIREGKDVVGQSGTGSGKTAAFGLPLLEKVQHGRGIQALILTPTRELCVQVCDSLNSFGKHLHIKTIGVYGGVGINPQIDALRRADIVVGTPGRILDHMERRTIGFSHLNTFILDEADKMLEMGFIEDVERIISAIPKERQTLLFSATISGTISQLIKKHLKHPAFVKTNIHVDRSLLRQIYYPISQREKFSLLTFLLKNKTPGLSMVFVATRREADIVAHNLYKNGVKARAIHGGMSQAKRLHTLDQLKKEHIDVMVATDVAARGLDVKNISHVYNYDVPKTSDDYVHRIGRTARAGAEGDAITMLSERDYDNFNNVLRDRTINIKKEALPQFPIVPFNRAAGGDDSRGSSGGRGPHRGGHSGPRSGGFRGGGHGRPSGGASGRKFRFNAH